jgi:hypothetical protein
MNYFKNVLCGIAAVFLAEVVPSSWSAFRDMNSERATGLAAVAGGFVESIFSPLFWILAVLFFMVFFRASRLGNKLLRILFFWVPTVALSTVSISIVALLTYAVLHFRHVAGASN